MRIVIMWARFGPYHIARLRGAQEVGAIKNNEIIGMEIARSDSSYDWDIIASQEPFQRVTVFPDRSYESLSKRDINDGVVRVLNFIKPDAVAINGWGVPEALSALWWCQRKNNVAAILMSESKVDDSLRVWWKESLKGRIVKHFNSALVGGCVQAQYLRQLGFPSDGIFFGYDVVDNDYFRDGAAIAKSQAVALRGGLGLPRRYFFACTRLLPRKNVDNLLQAYANYRAQCTSEPWGLVIAGSGVASGNLRQLERELGLVGVVWPGFIQYNRLPTYYGLASAFVHPANREPWGLVVNEAAASSLPLLVSESVGARYELLREGLNGYIFDPSSIEEMAKSLLELGRASVASRAEMGRQSHAIVARYSPRFFGEQLHAAFDYASNID